MTEITAQQIEIARDFATGRVGAVSGLYGDTFECALARGKTWVATLGKRHVHCPSHPDGFSTREEALKNARRVRQESRDWLLKHNVQQ